MAFCKYCGKQTVWDARFCPSCGAMIDPAPPQASSDAPPASATGADSAGFEPVDIRTNKVWAALCYFGVTFFLPMILCPDSKYGRFHANQGLILLIFYIAGGIVSGIFGAVMGFFWFFRFLWVFPWLFAWAYGVCAILLFLYGLINTLDGKSKPLPIIGSIKFLS